MARRRILTPERADALRADYAAYLANRPQLLAQKYGLSAEALRWYVKDKHKRMPNAGTQESRA